MFFLSKYLLKNDDSVQPLGLIFVFEGLDEMFASGNLKLLYGISQSTV